MPNLYSPRAKVGDTLTVVNKQTGATVQVVVVEQHPPMPAEVVHHDRQTGERKDQTRNMAEGWVKVEIVGGKK